MIDRAIGAVYSAEAMSVSVQVGGTGLVLRAECTPATVLAAGVPGTPVTLVTQLVAVREDLPRLFGFTSADDRELFRLLLSVTGVGCGTALRVMAAHKDPETIRRAIRAQDPKALKTKGVGPKIAAKIVAELAGKLGEAEPAEIQAPPEPATAPEPDEDVTPSKDPVCEDAYLALRTLEFEAAEARQRIREARERLGAEATTDAIVREVLVRL